MITIDSDAYLRAAASAALFGTPFKTLADAAREQAENEAAAKVLSLAEWRGKLRPASMSESGLRLIATLKNIDDVFNATHNPESS